MLKILRDNRYLLYCLVERAIRQQFIGSFLGILWVILRPLAWMGIYSFALSILRQGVPVGDVPIPVWILSGLISYSFFSEAVTKGVTSITSNSAVVRNCPFDTAVFPVSASVVGLVNHLVAVVILLAVMLIMNVPLRLTVLLLPIPMLLLFLYSLGWSYLVSAAQVYVRDVNQLVSVVLRALFFLTPIIYPEHLVPSWAMPLLRINPLFYFVRFYRQVLVQGEMPDPVLLGIMAVVCVLFCLAGKRFYSRLSPDFGDVL